MKRRPDIWKDQDILIRRYADGESMRILAAEYDCNWHTIRRLLALALSAEFMAALASEHYVGVGRQVPHKFEPGHQSRTQYEPGCLRGAAARRWVPIGTVRMRYRRNNRGRKIPYYKAIKVRDDINGASRNWIPVAVHVWEAAHGPVPTGYAVLHRDGNRLNDSLDNLFVAPPSERILHAKRVQPKRFDQTTPAKRRRLRKRMQEYWAVRKAVERLAG